MIRLVYRTARFLDLGYETIVSGPTPSPPEMRRIDAAWQAIRNGSRPADAIGVVTTVTASGRPGATEVLALCGLGRLTGGEADALRDRLGRILADEASAALRRAADHAPDVRAARQAMRDSLEQWLADLGADRLPVAAPERLAPLRTGTANLVDQLRQMDRRRRVILLAAAGVVAVIGFLSYSLMNPGGSGPNATPPPPTLSEARIAQFAAACWPALSEASDPMRELDAVVARIPSVAPHAEAFRAAITSGRPADPFLALPEESAPDLRAVLHGGGPTSFAAICQRRRQVALWQEPLDSLDGLLSGDTLRRLSDAWPSHADDRRGYLDMLQAMANLPRMTAGDVIACDDTRCLPFFSAADMATLERLAHIYRTILISMAPSAGERPASGIPTRGEILDAGRSFENGEILFRGQLHRVLTTEDSAMIGRFPEQLAPFMACRSPNSCEARILSEVWARP